MEVSDHAYETALLVYKLALPESGRWLQTRETFAMNLRNLLDGDVFTYRCGEVRPGGYHPSEAAEIKAGQFGVNELEREYVERELAARNIVIDYSWIKSHETSGCPTHRVVGCVGTSGVTTDSSSSIPRFDPALSQCSRKSWQC